MGQNLGGMVGSIDVLSVSMLAALRSSSVAAIIDVPTASMLAGHVLHVHVGGVIGGIDRPSLSMLTGNHIGGVIGGIDILGVCQQWISRDNSWSQNFVASYHERITL